MNLLNVVNRLAGDGAPGKNVALAADTCLHARDVNSPCMACFEICPVEAIRPGKPPTLEADACVGCLACLPVCPVGAYTAHDAVPDLVSCVRQARAAHIELLCERHEEAENGEENTIGIRVRGCLAGIGTGTYLLLVAQGAEQVTARTDGCAACPWASLAHQIESQVAEASQWMSAWNRAEVVTTSAGGAEGNVLRPLMRAEAPPLSRRDLLRGGRQKTSDEESGTAASGYYPFRERLRLIRAVQQLPPPGRDVPSTRLTRAGFALVQLTGTCTACGTCARACPSSALEITTEGNRFQLTFAPLACVGCDRCQRFCPERVIELNHAPHFIEVFEGDPVTTLAAGSFVRCRRCRAPFVPAQATSTLCPLCEFRRENPFGSRLPPDFSSWEGR